MATEVIHIIDPDGTGDYLSLNAWEVAQQRDLVSADEIAIAECISSAGSADSIAVTIDGWTTDSTRYVKIQSTGTNKHNGVWDDTKYRLIVSSLDTAIIYVQIPFCKISGVQVQLTATGSSLHAIRYQSATGGIFEVVNNLIKGHGNFGDGSYHGGVLVVGGTGADIFIVNNIFYDWYDVSSPSYSFAIYNEITCNMYIYNNTMYNCSYGVFSYSSGELLINNLANNCTDGYYTSGGFSASCSNNLSDITSDAPGANSVTGTVAFVDATNDDFRLSSSDTVAKDAGTDLSGDANYPFSTDIVGTTRTGTWDIGAHEYVITSTLTQEGFRFYNDDGSESTATAKDSQDTGISLAKNQTIRIRVLVDASGDPDSKQFTLKYKKASDADSEKRVVN